MPFTFDGREFNLCFVEQRKSLEDIEGANLEGVRCDTHAACLPGTRLSVLQDIMSWVAEPEGKALLWLHGLAGTGKSTIANTIASRYMELGLLGASFRFSRDVSGRNVPRFLVQNIAYQPALFNGRFREGLLHAIKQHGKMNTYTLREQFGKFIIEPLNNAKFLAPIVIIVDALDECGVEGERTELLFSIAKEIPKLPSYIKVFLTSRTERDIRANLERVSFPMAINDVQGIDDDIMAYINFEMDDIIQFHLHLKAGWPGPEKKEKLLSRTDQLFIWIAVASRYIKGSLDPDCALDDVLRGEVDDGRREATLDNLYLGILQRTTSLVNSVNETMYVLGSIVIAEYPFTCTGLDSLLGLGENTLRNPVKLEGGSQIRLTSSAPLINALGSILKVNEGLVRVLYASVIDFITSSIRCTDKRFFVDTYKYHRQIVICCFKAMDGLKRDICGINDPSKFNVEVSDLNERLYECLPKHLEYACIYWSRHLIHVPNTDSTVYDHAKRILFTHLLHWIEVMSLLGKIDNVFVALKDTTEWFQVRPS
jgi:hypothetical protein